MANVKMEGVSVDYSAHRVIDTLSLDVKEGESLTIVGPSSCGKTTLMRALCGFLRISSGRIYIGDRLVSDAAQHRFVPPEERRVGVVFQDYAVWPHRTVLENVVYPLKKRKVPKAEATRAAYKALEQVRMSDYSERMPAQLSGGQQQRVALARALISSSELLVLDEPITNLDAKLREEMAYEIRSLQSTTGVTVLYITHDQATAMTIGDRMVIMDKEGHIRQVGTPEEIWNNPTDKYVFEFLGVSNFIPVKTTEGRIVLRDGKSFVTASLPAAASLGDRDGILMAIRPMDMLMRKRPQEGTFPGRIERVTYLGNVFDYVVSLGDYTVRAQQDSFDAFQVGVPSEGDLREFDVSRSVFYNAADSSRIVL